MDFKQAVSDLSEELKKGTVDRHSVAEKTNLLIAAFNEVIRSAKAPSADDSRVAELRKDLEKGERKYKKKVIDLQTVFEVAKELAGSLNLEPLIKTIVLTTMGHLLAETGVLFVLDESAGRFGIRAVKGVKDNLDDLTLAADDPPVRELAETGRAIPVAELVLRPGCEAFRSLLGRCNAELCVPILSKAKMNGVLLLGPKPGGMPFSESNLEFLATLGNFAAVAIENAKLYENLDRKVRDMSALYNISREINRSNDMETVLDLMLETVTTGFGVLRCAVVLFDELKGIYHIERCVGLDEADAQRYLEIILCQSDPLTSGEAVRVVSPAGGVDPEDVLFSVPLVAGNRRVGLLNIFRFGSGQLLSEENQQIYSIIASQMAPPLVLSQYLSVRNLYRENPFDFVYHAVNAITASSQSGSVGFTACRLCITGGSYADAKAVMQGLRPMLQETDVMLHSSLNEIVLLFPATERSEVVGLLDSVLTSLAGPGVRKTVVAFPDEADSSENVLTRLYAQEG